MSTVKDRKPLVIGDDGRPQQLQSTDELDIDLTDRVTRLERALAALVRQNVERGIPLPPEAAFYLEA